MQVPTSTAVRDQAAGEWWPDASLPASPHAAADLYPWLTTGWAQETHPDNLNILNLSRLMSLMPSTVKLARVPEGGFARHPADSEPPAWRGGERQSFVYL